MKKGLLLNSGLSSLISKMGHTDQLTIGDAGLPIPNAVERIDLAVTRGLPGLMPVLQAVMSELEVEEIVLAEELETVSPEAYKMVMDYIHSIQPEMQIKSVSHEQFKKTTEASKAVVRTGECTPYLNIILQAGVSF